MSKKSKKEFTLEEFDRNTLAQYFQGRRDGMFEAFELIYDSITELKRSLDNVWMIYDEADSLDKSSEEEKQKLAFAGHTLFILGQMFQDQYDVHIDKIKSQIEED